MKARKVKKKILARQLDCFPVKYREKYILVQSAYGSRNLVKVKFNFFDRILSSEVAEVKKRLKNES